MSRTAPLRPVPEQDEDDEDGAAQPVLWRKVTLASAILSGHAGVDNELDKNGCELCAENVEADVFQQVDLYDAVVVAAFGGLKANLRGGETLAVHPFWMILLAQGLFSIQMTSLVLLRLNTDMESTVHQDTATDVGWRLSGNGRLTMQMLMIFVCDVMIFKDLMGATRMFLFLINPTTWTDIRRVHAASFQDCRVQLMYRTPLMVVLCLWSVAMKFVVAAFVTNDSISIIFAADSAKDAIFDSLAITFLVDLDEICWLVVSVIFTLDDFSHYTFRCARYGISRERRAGSWMSWLPLPVYRALMLLSRRNFARLVEGVLAGVAMTCFYARQLAFIFVALDTNVMPSVRDICAMYRWGTKQEFKTGPLPYIYRLVSHLVFFDLNPSVEDKAQKAGFCLSREYRRLHFGDMLGMWQRHPKDLTALLLAAFAIMTLPFLLKVANRLLRYSNFYQRIEQERHVLEDALDDGHEEDENASLRKQLGSLQTEVRRNRAMNSRLQRELRELRAHVGAPDPPLPSADSVSVGNVDSQAPSSSASNSPVQSGRRQDLL